MTEQKEKVRIRRYRSPLGMVTLAASGQGLTGLWFEGQKYYPDDLPAEETGQPADLADPACPWLDQTEDWLDRYFAGEDPGPLPPLAPEGTPFRQAVWQILLSIPRGETLTYGQIADKMARQKQRPHMSAQAVGQAVGHNPISILIPCHRVLGRDGSLTGYAGGLDRKKALLTLEGVEWQEEKR